MTDDKIIDISESVVSLNVRLANLVIDCGEEIGKTMVPLNEVAALVLSNPHVSMTNAAMAGVAANGGIVVVSDSKFQPAGMLLPLDAHYTQGERFRKQAAIAQPVQKRLWQQIVRSKISAQAGVLNRLTGNDYGLQRLATCVASGDTGNHESQAAQRYWPQVFNNPHFRRNREADDQNRLLNYGYAVLRALTARAICSAGLHPALGVHHHNRYDPFALASDLMEPFRPLVDETVARIVFKEGEGVVLGKDVKRTIISSLTGLIEVEDESRSVFSVLAKSASSLASVYTGERKKLYLPEW
ncbi:type II CRISPR-associated endonuclease Cas1 [Geomobilimonas luticola]|uniref:CRISPR-associated endonuclease Cas1 n=1 Tax=Geomobilimonas luticola TaxID=1114878 RepID=A0ABS5SH83_9BACT|nr:type II CRISPR-associated endonuclease Cas1 [Geomobilimonas luticola]MBT0654726.1 type II CRISPR-associated endonuclease Cas1 [Geomobilimonas luticola]